jgi:hypothetical protein
VISHQKQVVKEFNVPTISGYSRLKFLEDGSIVLFEKSVVFNSENEVVMNGYENLYEFLSRNMQKHSRDEIIFKILRDTGVHGKAIRVPHTFT